MAEPDFASLRIGEGWTAPEAGIYRFVVPLPMLPSGVAETRVPREDNPPPGPWLKLGNDGVIRIITPPGEQDARGNTVHPLTREQVRQWIHALEWFADAHVEVVTDGG